MVKEEYATRDHFYRGEFGRVGWTSSEKIPIGHGYGFLHRLPRRALYEAFEADDFTTDYCIAYYG